MALEEILVNGANEILNKLLPVIGQQIGHAWGVKDDLRKLGKTLELIQALISDAEEKQITDATVRLWLKRLKDVVYDADDVMDEFCYETMRRFERGSKLKHKVRDFMSKSSNPLVFLFKMAGKIRAINKSLDEINNYRVRYTLNATAGTSEADQIRMQRDRLTASVVDDSVLLGREDATSEIVKMLTSRSLLPLSSSSTSAHCSSLKEQLSVVSIVGMGGLGKTSLAQLVYKDESIKTHFDKKVWLCVSNQFDVYRILKEILESLTDGSCRAPSNVDVLARQVKENLAGKKYLLVLDDLWNQDSEDWEKLHGVLVNGVEGSKILVTTRSQQVAFVVGGKVHNLQKLTDGDCWSIMQKRISLPIPPNMINIGRDIAKKCDGLPLAANFLGSLLHSKREERDWVSINDDKDLWLQPETTRLISILKLSYDNLVSPLKQCFSYCCLFPKDWQIERETLIRMWVAEGFIQSNGVNNISFEDIGNDYFELLLSKSFFQDRVKDELGVILSCKLHDIVHDLATSVIDREEYGILQLQDGTGDASKIRRLKLVFGEGSSFTITERLSKAKKLRTVVALAPRNCSQINSFLSKKRLRILCPLGDDWGSQICTSIPILKHLRYLDMSGCKIDPSHDVSLNPSYNLLTLVLRGCENTSVLLHNIKSLKCLRHLDLSHSDINLLPDSIVGLTNLQTLNLRRCSKFKELPEKIGLLIHLSFLDLSFTVIKKLPDSITCLGKLRILEFYCGYYLEALPSDFGVLTQLRRLDLESANIKELPESCTRTRCNLEIVKLGGNCKLPRDVHHWENLRHFTHRRMHDLMPRGIEKLIYLETLESYMVRNEEASQACSGSISHHHSGIEELASLNSLQELHIQRLENVRGGIEDAERAKLKDKTNLRELYLSWRLSNDDDDEDTEEGDDVEDDDMVIEGLQPHSNLKCLQIDGYSGFKLPKWMGSTSICLVPNLVSVVLKNCNRCEKLPPLGMLPCLRHLDIDRMKSVKCLGREFYYQQQQEEEQSSSSHDSTSTTSSLFPSLVRLRIMDMKNLEEWVSPPSSSFPLLEDLYMKDSPKLRSAPNSFPSLKVLGLYNTNGNAVNSILSASRVASLASLTYIDIYESPELIFFPLGALFQRNTPNLQSLLIRDCSELQGFRDEDDDGLNNNGNISLHKLEIVKCPALTSVPDLRLWTSLRELEINMCDKLKESIPYDLKTSLPFLKSLKVDFIQREDKRLGDPRNVGLINLMEK
ncbi:putative disease resistance protein RGA3 [Papaver somniferum]|uniref:putative disease resistance protein RGA3 n=1 Tax=Papaver somniferum TaxID=3469 RepID=UPI000E7046F4|nr:putative disease resistance protein RGA3 [Papaver somniferum]